MEITYTTEKVFTQQQIQDLFWSVRWVSGQYPEQLYKELTELSEKFETN